MAAAFLPACSSTQSSSAKVTSPALVSKVTKYEIDYSSDAQDWIETSVFEYTDTEISPARYASMINYFLLEGGGNYYIYNWY